MHSSDAATQAALRALGRAVRHERRRRKLSQEDFAEACSVHRNYIGRVERAEINLSFDTFHRIASALGLSVEQLAARARI